MPAFREVWLSGGEPTLREELGAIVELFYRQNGVRSINLPANGLFPDRLAGIVERRLDACPELEGEGARRAAGVPLEPAVIRGPRGARGRR
jgi:organic radical activating enzyme